MATKKCKKQKEKKEIWHESGERNVFYFPSFDMFPKLCRFRVQKILYSDVNIPCFIILYGNILMAVPLRLRKAATDAVIAHRGKAVPCRQIYSLNFNRATE
jgi:hypothetical protein